MRVASAPVSFGIFELTADDAGLPDPVDVLDAIAETGHEGTELGPPGYFGDAAGTSAALQERKLELVGSFLPLRLSRREHIDEDFAFLDRALGILDETTPPGGTRPYALISDAFCEPERLAWAGQIEEHPDTWLSDARFALLVANAQRAAEKCLERGYRPAFHYHGGTYVETPREIDRFAAQVDPGVLGFCFDSGHSAFGGGDPVAFLDTYGELVTHVHLKDVDLAKLRAVHETGGGLMRAWESGVFCPLGTGDARVEECLAALRDRGYDDWIVVEQDRVLAPAEPFAQVVDDARANREWLAERGL